MLSKIGPYLADLAVIKLMDEQELSFPSQEELDSNKSLIVNAMPACMQHMRSTSLSNCYTVPLTEKANITTKMFKVIIFPFREYLFQIWPGIFTNDTHKN